MSWMPRSLRWTLIGWYGLLLAAVIAIFGALLHGRVSRAVFAGVDATVESRARAILGALEWDERDGWELELSDEFLRGLADGGWFEVADAEGTVIRHGGPVPASARDEPLGLRENGSARVVTLAGPRGTLVRVGRSIETERAALRALLGTVAVAGAGLLVLALLGGWWLATRTLRPIERMSGAASRISEQNLSQRIDPSEVPAELRELARTLNDAFERLELAFQRQARFTADASHELRTPLSVIRAQTELALRRDRAPKEYREALAACLRSAERMTGLVEGLLALARADADTDVIRSDVAFDAIVREAAREAHEGPFAADVALRLDLAPAQVRGDPHLLAEVVSNLVTNAIRYSRESGHIDVRLRAENGSVVLQVADDGPGIPAEALPHVFERFFRVDPARSRERGGSGHGRAITRGIVEAHGGSITAESRLGEGSTFTVKLPAMREGGTVDGAS